MKLLECIETSLRELASKQGVILDDDKPQIDFISKHNKIISKEGYLFWSILFNSYKSNGEYDYKLIIKLYHKYGKDVFKLTIPMEKYYFEHDDKFDSLYNEIDSAMDTREKALKYLDFLKSFY